MSSIFHFANDNDSLSVYKGIISIRLSRFILLISLQTEQYGVWPGFTLIANVHVRNAKRKQGVTYPNKQHKVCIVPTGGFSILEHLLSINIWW